MARGPRMVRREAIERWKIDANQLLDEHDLTTIGNEALAELRRLVGLNPDGSPIVSPDALATAVGQ